MKVLKQVLLLAAVSFVYSNQAVAAPGSCILSSAEIKNFQKISGRMFTVQSSTVWPLRDIVDLYMEDLSKPLAQPIILSKKNKLSIKHQFAERLVNNLSQAPGIMRFDAVPAGTYKISVIYYNSCGEPTKQSVLSESVNFSGIADLDVSAPIIQSATLHTFAGYYYVIAKAADLESGLARLELLVDGQVVALLSPEGRHGADNLNGASRAIYSLSGGMFDFRATLLNAADASRSLSVRAIDIHGNSLVLAVQP